MLPFLPASSGTSSNAEMCHCVHVSMCMSVTAQVLVNERQTESGEHSREQREGMRKDR